jgi:hypothetical protein
MTSQEFITWLKGFTEGVHEYNVTPKQWDLLKEKLAQVNNPIGIAEPYFIPSGSSGRSFVVTTNGAPNWYSSNLIENDSREK